jgi:glutathione synthase/RimK-type ligase-like ATP-grasp enzyme
MIGLATYRDLPELSGGEQLLCAELKQRTACKIVVWDDPAETWRECEQIIIRCTWDYSWRLPKFLEWIENVERAGIKLHNAPEIIRWNIDKHYLLELQRRGVEIPDTVWLPRGELTAERLAEIVTQPCVIKPAVSAGAHNTHRVSPDNAAKVAERMKDVAREKDLLVQEFMPEIETRGEYSLIFFRGEFSHAVLKTPAANDFRVQPRHGGQQVGVQVVEDIVKQSQWILEQIPFDKQPLYARVDGVLRSGRLVLMELELIEPYLFLEMGDNAAAKFGTCLDIS